MKNQQTPPAIDWENCCVIDTKIAQFFPIFANRNRSTKAPNRQENELITHWSAIKS